MPESCSLYYVVTGFLRVFFSVSFLNAQHRSKRSYNSAVKAHPNPVKRRRVRCSGVNASFPTVLRLSERENDRRVKICYFLLYIVIVFVDPKLPNLQYVNGIIRSSREHIIPVDKYRIWFSLFQKMES